MEKNGCLQRLPWGDLIQGGPTFRCASLAARTLRWSKHAWHGLLPRREAAGVRGCSHSSATPSLLGTWHACISLCLWSLCPCQRPHGPSVVPSMGWVPLSPLVIPRDREVMGWQRRLHCFQGRDPHQPPAAPDTPHFLLHLDPALSPLSHLSSSPAST